MIPPEVNQPAQTKGIGNALFENRDSGRDFKMNCHPWGSRPPPAPCPKFWTREIPKSIQSISK